MVVSISDRLTSVHEQGFAMGDAVLGRGDVAGGSLFGIEFMHGHAQFSDKTYQQIMSLCHPNQLEGSMRITPGDNCSQAQVNAPFHVERCCHSA